MEPMALTERTDRAAADGPDRLVPGVGAERAVYCNRIVRRFTVRLQ